LNPLKTSAALPTPPFASAGVDGTQLAIGPTRLSKVSQSPEVSDHTPAVGTVVPSKSSVNWEKPDVKVNKNKSE
jgi:hypothetical protein